MIALHRCLWTIGLLLIISPGSSMAENATPRFKIVVLAEAGGIHRPFVNAAKVWLDKQAAGYNFSVDYIQDTAKIDDAFLSRYQVFIQLNYPPYGWAPTAMAAFTKYIEEGRGDGSGFITPRYLANLTDTRCGHGSLNSWEESDSPTIFRSLPRRRSS